MTPTTAYAEPTGAQVMPYYNPAQPLKTNDAIMREWLHNGWTFSRSSIKLQAPRKSVRSVGTKLYWYAVLIAEHFEHQTVLYQQKDTAAANLSRSLRKLMVDEANWQPVDLTKQDNMDAVLASIFT